MEQLEEFMEKIDVLLVDDEPEFLVMLEKRLGKRQLSVRCASSGERAVEEVRKSPPEVVVLDVKMPDMDGIETLRRIKELAPEIEVLMLTGHANLEAAAQGMDLGAFDFLIKPVAINELLNKIQDACKSRRLRGQGGSR